MPCWRRTIMPGLLTHPSRRVLAVQTVEARPRPAIVPILAITVTVLLWASAFVAIRHVGKDFSPGALSLGRLLVGSVVLGVVVVIRGNKDPRPDSASPWPVGRAWIRLIVCGVLWFGLYNVALNAAEQRIDAGTAAMLVNIGPILIAILAGLTLGERFGSTFVVGAAIAFLGVIIIGVATSHEQSTDLWGVVLCLVAAVAYAIGVVSQKPLLAAVSALRITWLACTIGAIVCLPFIGQLISQLRHAGAGSIWLLVYLGALPTALAFTMWAYALARTSAGRLGVTTYLVPPIAALMGWAFLGETPVALAYVGGALCLVGVGVARRKPGVRIAEVGPGELTDVQKSANSHT
jgi:drug/metabolite transporter (DMT)-like permease